MLACNANDASDLLMLMMWLLLLLLCIDSALRDWDSASVPVQLDSPTHVGDRESTEWESLLRLHEGLAGDDRDSLPQGDT